jgi:hypothetical protein
VDGVGNPVCTLIFPFGTGLPVPTTVDDLAQGVSWTEAYTDSGEMTWTVQATFAGGTFVSGTVDAVGASFPSPDGGCNGVFPPQTLLGGKSN